MLPSCRFWRIIKASMALSFSCGTTKPFLKVHNNSSYEFQRPNTVVAFVRCELKDSSEENHELQAKSSKLEKGSPIIIIEAPKMMKTAASVPCLRVNSGLVKPGDVGRYFYFSSSICIYLSLLIFCWNSFFSSFKFD